MRLVARGAAAASMALLAVAAFTLATSARASTSGLALIVGPTSGGSATAFSLRLAENAACSGDSAHDGFRVQSYMVPAAVDPATLRFGSAGPEPIAVGAAFRQPLYSTTTSGFANAQTANADHPGDTGAIINVPSFSLAVFAPGDIPPGAYNVGVACTRGPASATQLDKVWNATFVVKTAVTDAPAGVTWTTEDHGVPPAGPSATFAHDAALSGAVAAASPSASGDHARQPAAPTAVAPVESNAPARLGGPPSMNVPLLQLHSGLRLTATLWIALCLLLASFLARIATRFTRKSLLAPAPAG